MIREIIQINEGKCDGCGLCVPNCHEGALQIIDDKAVLISDLMCDGLGACIGHCPQGALTIEKREAESYDEIKVMKEMIKKGRNVVVAHLKHLKDHGENDYLRQGVQFLMHEGNGKSFDPADVIAEVHAYKGIGHGNESKHVEVREMHAENLLMAGGCPGSRSMSFNSSSDHAPAGQTSDQPSALRQWPVQLHLVNPRANYFSGSDLLVSADCVAYSIGNFHSKYLKSKTLVIACPKLDSNQEIYRQKLKILINEAGINTITVMIMEVPCCGGLVQMVQMAASEASRKIPVKMMVVGIRGEVLQEEWV